MYCYFPLQGRREDAGKCLVVYTISILCLKDGLKDVAFKALPYSFPKRSGPKGVVKIWDNFFDAVNQRIKPTLINL